eukprot:CAMPEP_0194108258 /NCGR_PEP_ID=MMETSP0150-20130528/8006_1 /TAXON_ID=122233 /ORGANISM="Chaetoceros debilis, Strain MM31A-1" /LENGTH=510 /DNA_ID=CAMNT_0038796923 /DNA_START=68 /DNA_END=1600 /DNA_ORIENTATION=-
MQNLESLPDSTLSHVLSFLLSKELLALRSVGNRWLSTFFSSDGHENEQAEFLWRQALARDFKFTPVHFRCGSSDPLHHLRTLRIKTSEDDDDEEEDEDNENELGTSIFGYTARDSIYVASNAFESWRYWSKVSRIFFQGTDKSDTEYVNGPYFLRAAELWAKVEMWCSDDDRSGELGSRIIDSLEPGARQSSGRFARTIDCEAAHAYEAIFAFHDGQKTTNSDDAVDVSIGLFGCYRVYDHHCCMTLHNTRKAGALSFGHFIAIAGNNLSQRYNNIILNVDEGIIQVCGVSENGPSLITAYKLQSGADVGLLWMEEYVRRLDNGEMSIRKEQFGRLPPLNMISPFPNHRSSLSSRKVTRGIEIVASSIPAREIVAVVYSLQIRILNPDEEGYLTPSVRGYETCQLSTRHWVLTNNEDGSTDNVSGEGVIGCFPVLYEGGYRDDQTNHMGDVEEGARESGTFVYQSCARMKSGHFEGRIKFYPGSINDPSGEPFYVDVGRFDLNMDPDLCY